MVGGGSLLAATGTLGEAWAIDVLYPQDAANPS
jgi:hypothetical protein